MKASAENWPNYWKDVINDKEHLQISVTNTQDSEVIGHLIPITFKSTDDKEIVSSLTSWRKEYGKFFFTDFQPNDSRTKNWLLKVVLSNPSQMLFLIYSKNILIGQYGFKQLTNKSALMDNLLRGISGGHPKLMERSMIALTSWLFENLGLDFVTGSILSDNPYAMIVNKAAGFEYVSDKKVRLEDGRFSREIILTRKKWESFLQKA